MQRTQPSPELALLIAALILRRPNVSVLSIEDAASEVFAHLKLAEPGSADSNRNTLKLMVIDALNYLRREARRLKKQEPFKDETDARSASEGGSSPSDIHDASEQFLAMFPPEIIEIIKSRYLDQKSYEELSKEFGKPADTLNREVLRAIESLREHIPSIEWETWGAERKPIKKAAKSKVKNNSK
jgi:RNA polymerase sigma factor (sigma-70 family)